MSTVPKVSIVTPNYNFGKFIGQTIESIMNQNYENIQHIIVDDGSTDNSVEIIKQYIYKNPNKIKLIQQPNKGQTTAINVGLRVADGDIVGWINSDDLYCDNVIESIVEEFLEDQKTDIIFGDLSMINNDGEVIKIVKQLPMDEMVGIFFGFGKLVASNTLFWRSSMFKKVGFLNEKFLYNMDGEFFSRLFIAGKSKHIKHCIAKFRVHPSAKSSDMSPEKRKRFQEEMNFELQRSYSSLFISKILPYSLSFPLRIFYRMKRVIFRFIRGHYLKQKINAKK